FACGPSARFAHLKGDSFAHVRKTAQEQFLCTTVEEILQVAIVVFLGLRFLMEIRAMDQFHQIIRFGV
ncbi:MAG TPA: hypothetical protein VFA15_02230, partial [Nitrososphaera sp.]|nr:hypothetical protein [Nitrososphaera sp.]